MEYEETIDQLKNVIKNLSVEKFRTAKRSDELEKAYGELTVQHDEIRELIEQLTATHKELIIKNDDLKRCSEELVIANKDLTIKNEEKEKQAEALIITNKELVSLNEQREQRIAGLEEMLFMISHKVRQPVTQILGLAELIENVMDSPERLKVKIEYIQQSAQALDTFTKELSAHIQQLLPACVEEHEPTN